MAGNGLIWLKWMKMLGNSWKWLERMNMAGRAEIGRNGFKRPDIAVNEWNQ